MGIDQDGFGKSFNRYGLHSDSAIAATPTFYLSEALGLQNNTGTDIAHPIPKAEWSKRTGGLVPTIPSPWVFILDGDTAPLQITYARIPSTSLLWISGKKTTIASSTIDALRTEAPTTQTPRGTTVNAFNTSLYQVGGPSPYRLFNVTKNAPSLITTGTLLEAAHVFRNTAPYGMSAPAPQMRRPTGPTEYSTSDTIRVETLALVGEIQIQGTVLDSDPPDLYIGVDSYTFEDSPRILIQDLEINAPVPSGGISSPGSTLRLSHGGDGQVWYWGCGVGNVILGDHHSTWWACRMDGTDVQAGVHQMYGCLFGWNYIQSGGSVECVDAYFDTIAPSIFGSGRLIFQNRVHVPISSNAIFDTNLFAGWAFDVEDGGIIQINSSVYGANNPVGVRTRRGGRVYINPGADLNSLRTTSNDVDADGTLTSPNTAGTFHPGINGNTPSTGSGVYVLTA